MLKKVDVTFLNRELQGHIYRFSSIFIRYRSIKESVCVNFSLDILHDKFYISILLAIASVSFMALLI